MGSESNQKAAPCPRIQCWNVRRGQFRPNHWHLPRPRKMRAMVENFFFHRAREQLHSLLRSIYFDPLAFREELIHQIFDYDEVAQGHAPISPPFAPLDPVRHQPKRMDKRRKLRFATRKQRHKTEQASIAPPAKFTCVSCPRVNALPSGTAVEAARLTSIQKCSTWMLVTSVKKELTDE